MIAVTGATGTVGGALVRQLAAQGTPHRIVVRDPDKARMLFGPDVDAVRADLADGAALEAALRGADRVFLLTPTGPGTVESTRTVVEAAARAGVRYVVKLSALGTAPDSPLQLARWHAEAEEVVRGIGVAHTFLQPGSFMQNLLFDAPTIAARGEFYAARGDGRRALIDARDIAAAAAVVLSDPDAHTGKTHLLTGPEALSDAECADALSHALGRPVRYVAVPADTAREGMRSAGMPDWLIDDLLFLDDLAARGHIAEVLPTLAELLPRAPHTFTEFATDYADAFRG